MDSEQLLAALREDIEWPAATVRLLHNDLDPLEEALKGEPALLEIPARTCGAPRFLVIGRFDDKHWSAVNTHRGSSHRLISVRRSRPEKIRLSDNLWV